MVFKNVYLLLLCGVICCAYGDHLSAKQEDEITKYIEHEIDRCPVHDVDSLDKCLRSIAVQLKPYMSYGIKAWDVPVLEPLFLENFKLAKHEGETDLDAHFKNIYVYGLSDFTITYSRPHPEQYSYDFGMHFPFLKLLGQYDIDGKLMILELKDKGPFFVNLTNVNTKVRSQFEVKDGVLNLKELHSDFTYEKINIHLSNLLHGSTFGRTVNEALNNDIDIILQELKPNLIKEMDHIAVISLSKGLQHLPLKKWQAAFKH